MPGWIGVGVGMPLVGAALVDVLVDEDVVIVVELLAVVVGGPGSKKASTQYDLPVTRLSQAALMDGFCMRQHHSSTDWPGCYCLPIVGTAPW
jgi:hypothetical protein